MLEKKLWRINDCIVFSLNVRNISIVGKFVSKITKERNINRGMKENVVQLASFGSTIVQSRRNATLS